MDTRAPTVDQDLHQAQASSDAEILERSLNDPESFRMLWLRHHDVIYRYVAMRVGPTVAEDVVSDAFFAAFTGRAKYDPSRGADNVLPWLLGIATNMIRRSKKAEARWLRVHATAVEGEVLDAGVRAAPDSSQALACAINDLSVRLREPLLLLALSDLSYQQIADALSIPVGTVRSRINRARSQISRDMKGDRHAE